MGQPSPLERNSGPGAGKSGLAHWWGQRLSAAALVPLGLWLLLSLSGLPGTDHGAVAAWAGAPLHAILLILLLATVLYHSSLGVQVVIEDYVHDMTAQAISLVLSKIVHLALAAAGIYSIVMVSAGSPA